MNKVDFLLLVRCLYSKQNNTWLLDLLVRCRVEHLKRNPISPCAHVLFSVYFGFAHRQDFMPRVQFSSMRLTQSVAREVLIVNMKPAEE